MIDSDLYKFLDSLLDDRSERKLLALIIEGTLDNDELVEKLINNDDEEKNDQV